MNHIRDPKLDGMFQQPQPANMVIAQPINDIQLVGLIAAKLVEGKTPAQAVTVAMELLAEAVVQMKDGGFTQAIEVAQQRRLANGARMLPTQ